jgi:putative SOS response-associated peptidase YedK
MCGRFTLRTPTSALVEQFLLETAPELPPRFNIAPGQPVAVVRQPAGAAGRSLTLLRWGLIPSWAKDPAIGNRMINARAESAAEKPAFRTAFRRRRCLIPADGYYEWRRTGDRKQPYYFHMRDGRPFAFAGLWELWSGGEEGADSGPLETCAVLTTQANDLSRPIHDRMPVILPQAVYDVWLDPDETDRRRLQPLLAPYDSAPMVADRVSTLVNNPRNDDPRCIAIQGELF